MKEKKYLTGLNVPVIALIVLILLIGGGLFFWYEYRPRMVRERCSIEAEKRADRDEFVYEIIYRHCLRKHGIEYTEPRE